MPVAASSGQPLDVGWLADGPQLSTLEVLEPGLLEAWPALTAGLALGYLNAARHHLHAQPSGVLLDADLAQAWRERFVTWAVRSRAVGVRVEIARSCARLAADLTLACSRPSSGVPAPRDPAATGAVRPGSRPPADRAVPAGHLPAPRSHSAESTENGLARS